MPSDFHRFTIHVTPKEKTDFFDFMAELRVTNISDTIRRILNACTQDEEIRSRLLSRLAENPEFQDNFEEAVDAYREWCAGKGVEWQEVDRSLSNEARGRVYLRNENGLIGEYIIRQGRFVVRKGGDRS